MKISKADKNNRRKDTRNQILNIAQNLIATQGLKALSMRKIAEQLGIQPPSLYTHFPSIGAIVEAVSLRVYGSFVNIRHDPVGSDEDMLARHIYGLVDHMIENPVYIQLMLQDFGAMNMADTSATVQNNIDKSFANVQEMLNKGAAAGIFRPMQADRYLAIIFGAGLISLAWTGFSRTGLQKPVSSIDQIKADLLLLATAFLKP